MRICDVRPVENVDPAATLGIGVFPYLSRAGVAGAAGAAAQLRFFICYFGGSVSLCYYFIMSSLLCSVFVFEKSGRSRAVWCLLSTRPSPHTHLKRDATPA